MHSPEQGGTERGSEQAAPAPGCPGWLNAVWTELSEALAADLADPTSSRTRAVLEKAITSVGQALELISHAGADRRGSRTETGSSHFGARSPALWPRSFEAGCRNASAARLELVIGSDLQYIRMNGTIVGCLVGCVIFLITWAGSR